MHACYHGASHRLCAILFPFTWQHVYIPILPARLLDILQARHVTPHLSPHLPHILSPRLLDILQAPVPFLMGIDEEVLALAERQNLIPNEVVQVDLDQNAIMCGGATNTRATRTTTCRRLPPCSPLTLPSSSGATATSPRRCTCPSGSTTSCTRRSPRSAAV